MSQTNGKVQQPRDAKGRFTKAAPPRRGQMLDQTLPRNQRKVPTTTIGVGGAAVYGGFVVERETSAKLAGQQLYTTYAKLLANTTIVAAGVRYFLNLISKASWKVEPAEDTGARGEEVAEQFEDVMYDMLTPWHRVIRRMAMFRFYGFGIQEWTAKRREDGLIGFLDIEPRPQTTITKWDVDEHGTVHGVIQESPQTFREIYLPRAKLVYAVDDSLSDSPKGLGLLRHIVQACDRLERYEQLEGFGFETDLRGVPIGRAPFQELRRWSRRTRSRAPSASRSKPLSASSSAATSSTPHSA